MKRTTKIVAAVMAVLMLLSAAGCDFLAKEPVTYDDGVGLTIVMPEGMQPMNEAGMAMSYVDNNCLMTAVREDFAEYAELGVDLENMSIEEYAALCVEANAGNGMSGEFVEDANGNLYNTYNATIDGDEFFYYCTVRKGTDAFWAITFACLASEQAKYEGEFTNWNNSIVVD